MLPCFSSADSPLSCPYGYWLLAIALSAQELLISQLNEKVAGVQDSCHVSSEKSTKLNVRWNKMKSTVKKVNEQSTDAEIDQFYEIIEQSKQCKNEAKGILNEMNANMESSNVDDIGIFMYDAVKSALQLLNSTPRRPSSSMMAHQQDEHTPTSASAPGPSRHHGGAAEHVKFNRSSVKAPTVTRHAATVQSRSSSNLIHPTSSASGGGRGAQPLRVIRPTSATHASQSNRYPASSSSTRTPDSSPSTIRRPSAAASHTSAAASSSSFLPMFEMKLEHDLEFHKDTEEALQNKSECRYNQFLLFFKLHFRKMLRTTRTLSVITKCLSNLEDLQHPFRDIFRFILKKSKGNNGTSTNIIKERLEGITKTGGTKWLRRYMLQYDIQLFVLFFVYGWVAKGNKQSIREILLDVNHKERT